MTGNDLHDVTMDLDIKIQKALNFLKSYLFPLLKHDNKKSCIDCSKRKRVERVTEIKRGQHIEVPARKSFDTIPKDTGISFYSHHAIVNKVLTCSGHEIEVELIHFSQTNPDYTERQTQKDKTKNIQILKSTKKYDLKYTDIYIKQYQHSKYTEDEIIRRAKSAIKEVESTAGNKDHYFEAYHLLWSNCEHFAHWCVAGEKVSFQVRSLKSIIKETIKTIFKDGCRVVSSIQRRVKTSGNTIESLLKAACTDPRIIFKGVCLGYLIYTICRTYNLVKKYNRGDTCWSCLQTNILALWGSLGKSAGASVLKYLVAQFALPLLSPYVELSLLIAIILLSYGLIWFISHRIQNSRSPFQGEKRKIENLSEVKIGDVLTLNYYCLRHDVIVTDVTTNMDVPSGVVLGVHYALPSIIGRRIITEDKFVIDLKNETVEVMQFDNLNTFSAEETMDRARKRIGEKKWNASDNRSPHFCLWAKVKPESQSDDEHCSERSKKQNSSKGNLSTFWVGYTEIHLMEEIEPGDVVQYKSNFVWNKGIVVGLRNKREGRVFEMDVMVEKGIVSWRCKLETRKINLHFDNLYLLKYHPARCYSKLKRCENALRMKNKRCGKWTQSGFIEECIMLK